MTVQQYLDKLNTRYCAGISTEHSYRGDLQTLLETIATDVLITNEPTRIACGAPDYIVSKKGIPVGYIEAKDIGIDLTSKTLKEQFERYRKSLNNLIITDYLEFQLFIDGEFTTSIRIGKIQDHKIVPIPENAAAFESLIKNFCMYAGQTIKSSRKLAEMMAAKAKLLANVIENALNADDHESNESVANEAANNTLRDQLKAFQNILIHDITKKEFADIYAQTIAYGMFAARLHDPDLKTFSRMEAAEQIPKSNPFLRKLFQYVAGYDLDDRIKWIVDALADIFRATDVRALVSSFGKATKQQDPIIHFYETFLSEYDPKLRKARGVWYTPEPVVNFIVRAVDDILKTEFNLPKGLADHGKIKIKVDVQGKKVEQEVHKVQILDPATGTGTFLAEVIRQVHKNFEGQQGIWSNYVENHLIPRLNGFELLMASYAMAHLKLDLLLTETGFKPTKDQRFRVYLTNSLEEFHPETGTLFANWLSAEANEANQIKRDTPVMVILGNPPYSGESANKGAWISNLMDDYKKEPGGSIRLKERNPKWINDDYVKFIRFGQHFIDKNGSGILAFINPHGYLDNPTFRGMRWSLLKSFDKIYTIDLHGNSNKKETNIDGSIDANVFDILQGVSINLFVKSGTKASKELASVYFHEIYGKRETKYEFLSNNNLDTIPYKELKLQPPTYFFVEKNLDLQKKYDKGFSLNELMPVNVLGYQTHRDQFAISSNRDVLIERINDFRDPVLEDSELKRKYHINESKDWILKVQRRKLQNEKNVEKFVALTAYRPFDNQFAILNSAICDRPRKEILQHILNQDNLCLLSSKQQATEGFRHCFVTNLPANDCVMSTTSREANQVFPLYLYHSNTSQWTIDDLNRTPNLNEEIIAQFALILGIKFTIERVRRPNCFNPIDVFDYVYASLHSPKYRNTYKEFLKSNFPRIPFPKNLTTFKQLVQLGSELREIHLFNESKLVKLNTQYPIEGSNKIVDIKHSNNRVFINETQYFDNVPFVAWDFYIGGYQPAQKWLKDRKGRQLTFDEILHYQKIVAALVETDRLMKEIDETIQL